MTAVPAVPGPPPPERPEGRRAPEPLTLGARPTGNDLVV